MSGIVLSFIVPAYNSASSLKRCLDSFLVPELFKRIEILIVNDGSTDDTEKIAASYIEKYSCFRLHNKVNGGHGSVINQAVNIINGKYFKVIDSDDWVKTENLKTFISALEAYNADVFFTHFRTIDSRNGYKREYRAKNIIFGQPYSFDDYWLEKQNIFQTCCFHGICYKTEFYRSCRISLSEGVSYEDQEYSTLPFAKVKSVVPLDIFIYEYSIGSPEQSMSDENQVKRLAQREQVFWKLLEASSSKLTETASDYFMFKTREFLLGFFMAALMKNPDKPKGRATARKLRHDIKERGADALLKASYKPYAICLIISYLGRFADAFMELRRINVIRKLALHIRGGGNKTK